MLRSFRELEDKRIFHTKAEGYKCNYRKLYIFTKMLMIFFSETKNANVNRLGISYLISLGGGFFLIF